MSDGGPEGITKQGARETVDDRVQSAVEVGEADACNKQLGDQIVGLAVLGLKYLDEHPTQACQDTWQKADGEHQTDYPNCSDCLLYVLLFAYMPFEEMAGNS